MKEHIVMVNAAAFTLAAALMFPISTSAESGNRPADGRPEDAPPPIMERLRMLREDRKEVREQLDDNRGRRVETRGEIQDAREDAEDARLDLKADTRAQLRNATSAPERRNIMQQAGAARRDIAAQRASTTAPLKDRLRDLVRDRVSIVRDRFAIAVKQLENAASRIDARIAKLKESGADTAAAERALADAKAKIEQVKVDAQSLATQIASVADTDDKTMVRETISAATRKTNESIKSARDALLSAVRALKAASDPTASTE